MSKYICSRCEYSSNIKLNFIRHLQRKTICKSIYSNDKIEDIYEKYFKNKDEHKLAQDEHKLAFYEHKLAFYEHKLALNSKNESGILVSEFKCNFCKKTFKHLTSKCRHEKHYCKDQQTKQEYTDLKELVDLLNSQLQYKEKHMKKEIVKKQNEIDKLMKKNGMTQINNIQNNIKLLAYRETDISHLTNSDYKSCLNRANFCVPQIIKKIHFNPKKPENHNIYISNIKNAYVMVYNGNKWDITDRNEFLEDIIEEKTNILEDKLMEWEEKGKNYPLLLKKFNRYLEKREVTIVITKIKQEIKFILFNNRHIILG